MGDGTVTKERVYEDYGDLPEVKLSDLEQDEELLALEEGTMSARIALSFRDMRRATRILLDDNPTEPRLLFYVLMSDVIFFLNFGMKFAVAPGQNIENALPSELAGAIGGLVAICFLFRTATLYLFSGVVAFFCRLVGGTGSWRDTRAGIFWASLVAAPIGVLSALVVVAMGYLAPTVPLFADPMLVLPAQLIGVIAFVYFVSASVAESHGFRNTSPIFVAFSLLTVAILVFGLYLLDSLRAMF
ncbi:MAG: YIP1 family protein [Pseudomonadota bacterium]